MPQSFNIQRNFINRETYRTTQDNPDVVRQIFEKGSSGIDEIHELQEEEHNVLDSGM